MIAVAGCRACSAPPEKVQYQSWIDVTAGRRAYQFIWCLSCNEQDGFYPEDNDILNPKLVNEWNRGAARRATQGAEA